MTGQEHLLLLLGEVDDQLVEEAADPDRVRLSRPQMHVRWGALAACAALVIALGGFWSLSQIRMGGNGSGSMDYGSDFNGAQPPAGAVSGGSTDGAQSPGAAPGEGNSDIGDPPSGEAPPGSVEGSGNQEDPGAPPAGVQDLPVLLYTGRIGEAPDIEMPGWSDGTMADVPETLSVYTLSQDGLQLIGDYPVLSQEEAVELLCSGNWPGFDSQCHIIPTREQIVRTELLYFADEGGCYLPCYRFSLALEGPGSGETAEAYYYIPAIESQYLKYSP